MTMLADFTLPLLSGASQPLAAYQGKVVLVVNTASQCGHTPQYRGLEALWRDFGDKGLSSWAFPATSSAGRSRAAPPRSPPSATSISASASRFSAGSTSTARSKARSIPGSNPAIPAISSGISANSSSPATGRWWPAMPPIRSRARSPVPFCNSSPADPFCAERTAHAPVGTITGRLTATSSRTALKRRNQTK